MPALKKRVLVVDDSIFARKLVSDILRSSPELEVVGTAARGKEALAKVKELNPDVVTLDLELPGISGLQVLAQLMQEHPVPVVVLSAHSAPNARVSIEALSLGAIEVVAKPQGGDWQSLQESADEIIASVIASATAKLPKRQPHIKHVPVKVTQRCVTIPAAFPIVVIASSTGGPRALRMLVPELTNASHVAYVIVQHLPEGFSAPLAQDLNKSTALNVLEATDGHILQPGDVVFAKAGYHCVFGDKAAVRLTKDPTLWGVRPSADITMASLVPIFGSRLIGVLLTGMGRDGANGLRQIKDAGGLTIAEHESTCAVYGMPRAAVEMDAVNFIVPLDEMAEAIEMAVEKVARAQSRLARAS